MKRSASVRKLCLIGLSLLGVGASICVPAAPAHAATHHVSIRMNRPHVEPGEVVHFAGRVSPAARGGAVSLQRHYGNHWHKVKAATLNTKSTYDIAVKPPTGTLKYRAVWASSPSPSITLTVQPAPPHFGDGIFGVGSDIAPGTYRTRANTNGCYWERRSGTSGDLSDIIENDSTNVSAIVTIARSDEAFKSERCGTWTQDLSPITKSKTASFKGGTYIVGKDISAGTWRSSGGDGCYWERVKAFSGNAADIIDNDFADGPAIAAIERTDVGFHATERCGTWTKIG
jgi:hypothetical protein